MKRKKLTAKERLIKTSQTRIRNREKKMRDEIIWLKQEIIKDTGFIEGQKEILAALGVPTGA